MALVFGMGACIAAHAIVREGKPVGYMYREKPASAIDSGWRFFTGRAKDARMTAEDAGPYDVTAVAAADPAIAAHLEAPVGSVFERGEKGFSDITPR